MYPICFFFASLLLQVQAAPTFTSIHLRNNNPAEMRRQNGLDAQALNRRFATLTQSSSCNNGETACVFGLNATCTNGQFDLAPCGDGNTCFAVPLLRNQGTKLVCDTRANVLKRFRAAGVDGGLTGDDTNRAANDASASDAVETITVTVTLTTNSDSASYSAFTQTQTLSAFTLTFTSTSSDSAPTTTIAVDSASAPESADYSTFIFASTSDALAVAATTTTDSAFPTDSAFTITLGGSTDATAPTPTITFQVSTAADAAVTTINLDRRQYNFFSSPASSVPTTTIAVLVSPSASLPPVNIVPTTNSVSPVSPAVTTVVTPGLISTSSTSTIPAVAPAETITISPSSQATVSAQSTVPVPITSATVSSQATVSTLSGLAQAPPATVTVTVATATVTIVSATTVLVVPFSTSSAGPSSSPLAAPSASDQVIDINGSPTEVLTFITLTNGLATTSTNLAAAVAVTTPAAFFTPTPY